MRSGITIAIGVLLVAGCAGKHAARRDEAPATASDPAAAGVIGRWDASAPRSMFPVGNRPVFMDGREAASEAAAVAVFNPFDEINDYFAARLAPVTAHAPNSLEARAAFYEAIDREMRVLPALSAKSEIPPNWWFVGPHTFVTEDWLRTGAVGMDSDGRRTWAKPGEAVAVDPVDPAFSPQWTEGGILINAGDVAYFFSYFDSRMWYIQKEWLREMERSMAGNAE